MERDYVVDSASRGFLFFFAPPTLPENCNTFRSDPDLNLQLLLLLDTLLRVGQMKPAKHNLNSQALRSKQKLRGHLPSDKYASASGAASKAF